MHFLLKFDTVKPDQLITLNCQYSLSAALSKIIQRATATYAPILLIFTMLSCRQPDSLFKVMPASTTSIHFVNQLQNSSNLNIIKYLYYYNGGGVAIGDVNNDGLADIYFTANSKGNNKFYLNKGNFEFEDITARAGVAGNADWCSGVTMADVNGDGYLDIYVSAVSNSNGLKGSNQLFINNGGASVSFTESAAKYGLNFSGLSTQAAFFDYDRDGDLDCYLLNHSQSQVGNIPDTLKRKNSGSISGDRLYRNDLNAGLEGFTDVTKEAGVYQSDLGFGLGLAVADFNNDGWLDIYIGNDFYENDYYYVNNGNGSFSESGAKHFNHYSRFSMGNDAADYNNDGQLDLITVDMLPNDEKVLKTYGSDESAEIYKVKFLQNGYQYQYSKNSLQQNNGNGSSFSEQSLLSGVSATDWSWCPFFVDFDNDGAKDLFITSGIVKRPMDLDYISFSNRFRDTKGLEDKSVLDKMPDGSSYPFVFKGDGASGFTDVSDLWGTKLLNGYFNGAAYADLDNDGNVDVVINSINAKATILKNTAPKKNFLSVVCKGTAPNTTGIGTKVYLFQNGKLQYQQLMLTRGFQSSSDTKLHFGLDSIKTLDSLLVVWPDQSMQVVKTVKSNQQIILHQKDASGIFDYNQYFKKEQPLLNAVENDTAINWKHNENDFSDFNVQFLIPHKLSTRGPKIAVADVNGDGLDDFYACGAKEQPGCLMLQQKNGKFAKIDSAVFIADARCEDVDAIFFDANGDGFSDLYVVSGGNEITGNNKMLLDRLYINNGKGHYSKALDALPLIFQNKSCITVADIDKDGDQDIFVGNLANANAYGLPQTSFLLLNNGKGIFSLAGESTIALSKIGMVTSASFADINNDGWSDLVVAGEWMPITVFINKKAVFEKSIVPHSTGWWQTLFIDDVNQDGQLDILAGNWGWNNKFCSGKNGPVKLYVADFDKNGQTDQLLSYTRDGREYPFLAKDEVERPLPVLKKHYLLYADYAGVEMKEVFKGFVDDVTPLEAERLGSAVCYGNSKGGFNIVDLPLALQRSPIFAFQKVNGSKGTQNHYLSAGNFFDVIPYEGRYDAQPLALFQSNQNNIIKALPQQNLSEIKGQFRDLKWVHSIKHGPVIVAGANNEGLLILTLSKR